MSYNYRLVATKLGDLLKWDTAVKEIDRSGQAIFNFRKENFPNDAISSVRAQSIYDWILSLAKQEMNPNSRNDLLLKFCKEITPSQHIEEMYKVIEAGGITLDVLNREDALEFGRRSFHSEIAKHSKYLFLQGNYFHAVFEACKVFNKQVKSKAMTEKDGTSVMLEVWGWERGVLKITPCKTQTDKDIQEGVKFLSAGLMQALRNPTSHEPALDWPISKEDCLDMLSFVSFLFRQLDKAVYYKS